MPDVTYDILTKNGVTLTTEFNTGDPNNWTRGQSASFTFELPDFTATLDIASGDSYTVTADETYSLIRVRSGATLTVNSGVTLTGTRLLNEGTVENNGTITLTNEFGLGVFEAFVDWAGSFTTLEMLNNTVKYRVQIPDNAAINSLVWGIQPSQDISDNNVVGVWGIVESIQNQRNQPLTTNRYQVDVTVLSPLYEYATIEDVENDLVI